MAFDNSEIVFGPRTRRSKYVSAPLVGLIDSFSRALLNGQVEENRDRWRLSLSVHHRKVLKPFANDLKWAWDLDKKDPKSYPLNTDHVFFEINKRLRQGSRGGPEIKPPRKTVPLGPPQPKSFSDLVDEKIIKVVFEQQNDVNYVSALKLAASGDTKADSTWRKILRAVNAAYFIRFRGMHCIPRPRVHFLHRELLKIAKRVGINDISHEGIAEFLDDLCPCGKKHEAEAIRKLRKRWSGWGRAKK
jgi:hypothetical protein